MDDVGSKIDLKSSIFDVKFVDLMVASNQTEDGDFKVDDQGVLRFRERICIPDNDELKKLILEESHRSSLSIHPGATKMYHDLKKLFWWSGLKRDVAQFAYACLTCQKSKVEHQKPAGLLTPLDVPEWKWDSISMQNLVRHEEEMQREQEKRLRMEREEAQMRKFKAQPALKE